MIFSKNQDLVTVDNPQTEQMLNCKLSVHLYLYLRCDSSAAWTIASKARTPSNAPTSSSGL